MDKTTQQKARQQIMLAMLGRLEKREPFVYKDKRVEVQTNRSGIPFYRLKTGKLMLQNPNKTTLYAKLAKLGIPIAWFIPDSNTNWELVTNNKLVKTYYFSDSKRKAAITKELNKRLNK